MDWSILISIWRPILEISILAVGFYYVFVLVRGTRGAAVTSVHAHVVRWAAARRREKNTECITYVGCLAAVIKIN